MCVFDLSRAVGVLCVILIFARVKRVLPLGGGGEGSGEEKKREVSENLCIPIRAS